MKTNKILLIGILTLLLFPSLIYKGDHPMLGIGAELPMATTTMYNANGEKAALNDLRLENGLIVVFSCNTCPFVVGSSSFQGWEKEYNSLKKQAEEAKIGFTLINSNEAKRGDEDSFEAMKSHAKKMKYQMDYLMDVNSELANAFGAKTTPHVFMFDKNMKLIYRGSIDNSWDTKRSSEDHYLLDAINNVSQSMEVKTNDTAPRGCSIKRMN